MRSLQQFIYESNQTTYSNKERKEKLEHWLKSKNYRDYIKTLNKMLDDPKAAALLSDGFGGELGDMQLDYSVKQIAAKDLVPTQSEIDISKSLKWGLIRPSNIVTDFMEPIIVNNIPLITFNGKYIIDGHHRWVEPLVINPNGKMLCFNYNGKLKPIEMLKAVQGAIAAVMADNNNNNGKIPVGTVDDKNIYDMSESEISDYINKEITGPVIKELKSYLNLQTKEDVIEYLVDNIIRVQRENKPDKGMPSRGEMPQTDKGGTEQGNKTSSLPTKDGSALFKLKNGKIYKDAIK